MEHQWFCGGKDPCACMDSWKEAELEKEEKDQMRRNAHSELGGGHSAAEIDRWLDSLTSLTYGEAKVKEADFLRRLESNVGKAISDDPAKPISPSFEEVKAKIKAEEWARWWMRRIESGDTYPRLQEDADFSERPKSNAELLAQDKAAEKYPGPPVCVHKWAFLRRHCVNDWVPKTDEHLEVEFKSKPVWVDVFFCRRCLEYRERGWGAE